MRFCISSRRRYVDDQSRIWDERLRVFEDARQARLAMGSPWAQRPQLTTEEPTALNTTFKCRVVSRQFKADTWNDFQLGDILYSRRLREKPGPAQALFEQFASHSGLAVNRRTTEFGRSQHRWFWRTRWRLYVRRRSLWNLFFTRFLDAGRRLRITKARHGFGLIICVTPKPTACLSPAHRRNSQYEIRGRQVGNVPMTALKVASTT